MADRQVLRLATANASADPTAMAHLTSTGAMVVTEIEPPSASDAVEVAQLPSLMDMAESPVLEAAQPESEVVESEPIAPAAEFAELLGQQVDEDDEKPSGFVISISMRGRCRRLHFAGGCFRVAGEHYKRFESFGQECPPETHYTHRCKDCFPSGQLSVQKAEEELEVSADEESLSSSSSSQSDAAEPEPADS